MQRVQSHMLGIDGGTRDAAGNELQILSAFLEGIPSLHSLPAWDEQYHQTSVTLDAHPDCQMHQASRAGTC
jgi:hypothetical protein